MTNANRSTCEVAGCDDPATGSYLHSGHGSAVEFRVCAAHLARLRGGSRPSVVVEGPDGDRSATLVVD